jgi:hypothetical protein
MHGPDVRHAKCVVYSMCFELEADRSRLLGVICLTDCLRRHAVHGARASATRMYGLQQEAATQEE